MGPGHREVVWADSASSALDEAVGYVSLDSAAAGIDLLQRALDAASSLAEFAERGRVVPEISSPNFREIFVFKYRLIYEVVEPHVRVIAFLHGARDFAKWQRDG